MEWLFGFNKIFNKKIALPTNQTNDLVFFYRLKNDMLKIGSKAEVSEGYNLVTVHYNKVCDVLPQGDYELDGISVPALMKFCQKHSTKKGDFIPTSVFADIYFVNINKNTKYDFITPNYIKTIGQQGKVKIRLKGSFKMQIINVKRFMQSFCDVYAVVKNKNILKDLSYYVGRVVEKSFDKMGFVLSDYLGCKDKIIDTIMQNIADFEKDMGIKISNISIEEVVVPRRYKLSKGFLQDSKEAVDNSEYLIKLVEDRLNNLQEDMNVVFANSKTAEKEQASSESRYKHSNFNQNSQNSQNTENNSNKESIFVQNENNSDFSANNYDSSETIYVSNVEQQVPKIIAEELPINNEEIFVKQDVEQNFKQNGFNEKQDIQNNKDEELKETFENDELIEKKNSLISCPCCGAKNFEGAEFCCVCKSKLI